MRIALGLIAAFCGSGVAQGDDLAALIRQLQDPSPARAIEAANKLGELGPEAVAAVPALLTALEDDRSASRRELWIGPVYPPVETVGSQAFDALVSIGGPAVPALIAELDRDEEEGLDTIVDILREIGPPAAPAAEKLLSLATGHTSGSIRLSAYLAWIEQKPAREQFVAVSRRLLDDVEADVCFHALASLQRSSDLPAEVGERVRRLLRDERLRTHWISLDSATQSPLRQDAARFFADHPKLAAVARPDLIAMMRGDDDPSCQIAACRTLASMDETTRDEAISRLLTWLADSEDSRHSVQSDAVWALADLGPQASAALEVVRRGLQNRPADEVELLDLSSFRSGCVHALRSIAGAAAIPELQELVKSEPCDFVRSSAAKALGGLTIPESDRPSVLDTLTAAAQGDISLFVRGSAIRSLRGVGATPEFLRQTLEPMLRSQDEGIRLSAADGLEEMGRTALPSMPELERAVGASVSAYERKRLEQVIATIRAAPPE